MKFCKKCGNQLDDGIKFCTNCGTPVTADEKTAEEVIQEELPETPAPEVPETPVEPAAPAPEAPAYAYAPAPSPAAPEAAPEKKSKKKALVIACICLAAVIIAAAVIAVAVIMSKDTAKILAGGSDGRGNTVIIDTKGNVKTVDGIDPKSTSAIKISLNGKGAVIYTNDDENGSLYFYNGKEAKKIIITDEELGDLRVSADGKRVIYTLGGTIYSYTNGKSTKIADDATLTAVSPDGKTVAYYTDDGEDVTGYYNYNGKEQSLGKNIKPIAVSNGAKLVYYTKKAYSGENKTYVQKGTDESERVTLLSNENSYNKLTFNYDMTQVLFYKESGTYICNNGAELEKISSDAYNVYSIGTNFSRIYNIMYPVDNVYIDVFDTDDFENAVLSANHRLCVYKNKELKTLTTEDNSGITENGKTLIYLSDGSVYKKSVLTPDAEPDKVVEDVSEIRAVSDDGSVILYLNNDKEYMMKKGSGKPVRIADYGEISNFGILRGKLFYTADGKLYSTSDGKNKKEIDLGDGTVTYVSAMYGFMMVVLNNDTAENGYFSVNGTDFKLVTVRESTGVSY